MNGRERLLALIHGKPVDRIPVMPITMRFAAEQRGVKYLDYATDFNSLVDAQIFVAEKYGFEHVSAISDPPGTPDTHVYILRDYSESVGEDH